MNFSRTRLNGEEQIYKMLRSGRWRTCWLLNKCSAIKTSMWCIPHMALAVCYLTHFRMEVNVILHTHQELWRKQSVDTHRITFYLLGYIEIQYLSFRKTFHAHHDHKPLLCIFNLSKVLPAMTAARLQRYAVSLSGHSYDIIYKGTQKHCNADMLSRLLRRLMK